MGFPRNWFQQQQQQAIDERLRLKREKQTQQQQQAIDTANQGSRDMYNADGGYNYGRLSGGAMPSGNTDYATGLRQVSSSAPQSSDPRIQRLRNKSGNSRPQMQNSNAGIAQRSNRRYGTQEAHDNFNDMTARMTAGVNRLNARGGGRRNKAGRDVANPRTLDPNRNAPAPAPGTVVQGQIKA